ncbi:MAG: peptidylprolyl isomerase [Flavobacteriia bacterium]|jgi:FKBP-type peptidyl-prolyl cis-trans isomerase SlyD|nr:peptidylprolyl isomerase [Flavobacteriia bacterium]
MQITENTVVSLTYRLTDEITGEEIEQTDASNPLVFLYGVGAMIPDFELNLSGLTQGSPFNFSIPSAQAYGVPSDDEIQIIPINVFCNEEGKFEEDLFQIGTLVPMSDGQGNHLRGRIIEIGEEFIKMDFNHPLAGVDLHFEGEILEVRAATSEEIDHGHAHGPHGHQH